MSMEKRRDEIGKLLACLLVSRKGISSIKELERDYRENEGRNIPYIEFGCLSSLDFFRSISKHIRLEPRNGSYAVYPVVSDKVKHVNDLVSRQRSGKKHMLGRRRPARYSQYFPPVGDPKPFVPNEVQKKIARILTANPSGVNKSYIAQCLEGSNAIAGTVNGDNIDNYLRGMPYTAVASGNMVYPSRFLKTMTNTGKRNIEEIDGFEIVMPRESETRNETSSRNNTQVTHSYPAGEEEGEEIYIEDKFAEEHTQPHNSNMDNHYAAADNDYQTHALSKTGGVNKPRMSSAQFIDRAGSQYTQSWLDRFIRENNNLEENYQNGVEYHGDDVGEQKENFENNAECTFQSDDDELDIINPRMKARLQQLIQNHPDGIWCADLLQAYSEEFKVPLEYAEFGFGSVCEFASNLPEVFHLHRQNNRGDFRLYDATKPLPPSANKPASHSPSDGWEDEYYDEDMIPFPMELPVQTSQSLVPKGVMTYGESVGQERIPEIFDGPECLEVYVVEVFTPTLFWIHLRKNRAKLSRLMKAMHEFYQREGDNYIIPDIILEKGLNCVCTFENKWHRAIIKTVKPDGDVTLIFYDYGTTKSYPSNALRFLVRAYSNLPAQAIACGLYNVKPVGADAWTRGTSIEFYNKVADLPLVAMVVKVDKENNSMLVSLVDTQGDTDEHINDWLVDEGFAESGFMGDTVSLECSYWEDQTSQAQHAINSPKVTSPLVLPQSTLHESSGNMLKPPPGLTKPVDPVNCAAMIEECLNGRSYSPAELGNSTFLNFCNVNVNNNPLASHNATYNPLDPLSDVFIQFLKQRLQMELAAAAMNQLLLSHSNNSPVMNNIILNTSSTVSPATSINPITEQSRTNPCQTYQEANGQEFSTITHSLKQSTDSLINLNLNESNQCNVQNNTTVPNLGTLPNVKSRNSHLLGSNEQKLFSSTPIKEFGIGTNKFTISKNDELNDNIFLDKTQIKITNENIGSNDETVVNDEEFMVQQLHDTNPFKEHIIRSRNGKIESQKEQNLKINFEYSGNVDKPPIPPRNPNSINNTENIAACHKTNVLCSPLPTNIDNNQPNIPTTKIYYKANPVMYNSRTEKSNETKSRLGNETTKLTEPVSFSRSNHYDSTNSSPNFEGQSLSNSTLFNSEKTNTSQIHPNSSQLGFSAQFSTAQTNNISTSSTKYETNHTQYLNARILPNNYRPPPPSYNDNSSTEYLYKKKSPISPRYTSPMMSEESKAAIEELHKIESVVIEIPRSTKGGNTMKNLGIREEHTLSSSITNNNISFASTTSESPLNCQNAARSKTTHKIKISLPKFLREYQSTESSEQLEPSDTLNQIKVQSPSLEKTEKMTQNFIKHEQSSPLMKENSSTLPWSVEHGESHHLNGASPRNSERPESYRNLFETKTDIRTPAQACGSLNNVKTENTCSAIPTLHSQQASVNERYLSQKDGSNSNITFKGDVTTDNNTKNFSYTHQPQPQTLAQHFIPFYPNINHSPHGPNYPYHVPQSDMTQHWHGGPRVPLLRPMVHGFHPPPVPHWPGNHFINPGFAYAHNNLPPQVQPPFAWNPYNSHVFAPKQQQHITKLPNSQTSKRNCRKESVSLDLNHAQTGRENKENVNTVKNKETQIDISEVTRHTTDKSTITDLPDSMSCHIPEEPKNSHSNDTSNLKDSDLPTQIDESNTQTAKETISQNGIEPQKDISPRSVTNVFKLLEVNKQKIYLFNIENEGWASTDEIALTFTPYENRHMILRILELVQVKIKFMEVSRAQSPFLFSELDGTAIRLPRMRHTKKIRGTLHLTPLNSLIQMMYYLKVISEEEIICLPDQKQFPPGSKVSELLKLITAYKSDDTYWVR